MPIVVTMRVYSQRLDPSWCLSEGQARALRDLLSSLQERTPFKARGIAGRLGYRGFDVVSVPPSPLAAARLVVDDGFVDPGLRDTTFFDPERRVEAFLLSTAGGSVDATALADVEQALAQPAMAALAERAEIPLFVPPVGQCTSKAKDAPPFEPWRWNVYPTRHQNNCYNYANDQITNTYAQPGLAHGANAAANCPSTEAAAILDGLVAVADFAQPLEPGEGWYVALVADPRGNDVHWYRQDANGCWSHKLGLDPATNLDAKRQIITDPRSCKRAPYKTFCSFMITNRCVVII